MLFNSFSFLYFFSLVYAVYAVLKHRYQNMLLLVASYFFYGSWDWRFLSLIFLSTVVDYWCGLGIHRATSVRRRRLLLTTSVVANLGILFTFKYFGFFAASLQTLLATLNVPVDWRLLHLVLPVGISFYTFQTMSYTIDIYRGQLAPTRSFLNFAVFVAYFPQLVAGPIERASRLLPQIEQPRTIHYAVVREGLWLILLGYLKKLVIADSMASVAGPIFENPQAASGLSIVLGVYAFAFQIYGDFSGYSDIARGISKLMGIELMVNFRHPYFATNPSDFWRRWHISLSTWLRDYLYIPLGGNRGGTLATDRNLMITMLLGGLWHGAAWHFVAWGFYHGSLLIVHKHCQGLLASLEPASRHGQTLWRVLKTIGFFQLTCIGWLLFAVRDLGDVGVLAQNLLQPWHLPGVTEIFLLLAVLAAALLLVLELSEEIAGSLVLVKIWPSPARLACYAVSFAFIVLVAREGSVEFIYFQF